MPLDRRQLHTELALELTEAAVQAVQHAVQSAVQMVRPHREGGAHAQQQQQAEERIASGHAAGPSRAPQQQQQSVPHDVGGVHVRPGGAGGRGRLPAAAMRGAQHVTRMQQSAHPQGQQGQHQEQHQEQRHEQHQEQHQQQVGTGQPPLSTSHHSPRPRADYTQPPPLILPPPPAPYDSACLIHWLAVHASVLLHAHHSGITCGTDAGACMDADLAHADVDYVSAIKPAWGRVHGHKHHGACAGHAVHAAQPCQHAEASGSAPFCNTEQLLAGSISGTASSTGHLAACAVRAAVLRVVLQHHLDTSHAYDAGIVMQALHALAGDHGGDNDSMHAGSSSSTSDAATASGNSVHDLLLLPREAVLLQSRLGQHVAALRMLGLHLRDIPGAVAYCRRMESGAVVLHGTAEASSTAAAVPGCQGLWMVLLEILLRQGLVVLSCTTPCHGVNSTVLCSSWGSGIGTCDCSCSPRELAAAGGTECPAMHLP